MKIDGFALDMPEDVCDHDGLDERDARAHFRGKHHAEIDYSSMKLIEDLKWMNHQAFKYYLPGFLLRSLDENNGELASWTLGAIESHLSGSKANRIRFNKEQTCTLQSWFDLVLNKYGDDEIWGFKKRIAKYRERIKPSE